MYSFSPISLTVHMSVHLLVGFFYLAIDVFVDDVYMN